MNDILFPMQFVSCLLGITEADSISSHDMVISNTSHVCGCLKNELIRNK